MSEQPSIGGLWKHPVPHKPVVVVLPVRDGRVLMQLRDIKPDITVAGCWGFFGGGIDEGEAPVEAAKRELYEEIGYRPRGFFELGSERITDLDGMLAYGFCCRLEVPVESLTLKEGMDFGLKSVSEVVAKKIYSSKLGLYFPAVPTDFLATMMQKALNLLGVS